ncbi:MAG: hypothetical protein ACH349_00705 [Candidatus Rhabdochlamydia sp.]|jgi:hypothetical protein|nr:hypothetical protein [Chlamydiota bacterium]
MEIAERLRLAWQNDSFYMNTTFRKAVDIFIAGAIGYMAGRITKVISPRDGAIYSVAGIVSNTFINFMESRFIKGSLISDKDLEKDLRYFVKMGLNCHFSRSICSLAKVRGLEIFGLNKPTVKFAAVLIAINVVIEMAFKALFSFTELGEAS